MTDRYLRSTDGSDADDGSTWLLADATLAAAAAASSPGDRTFASQVHAESAGSAKNIVFPSSPGYQLICANDGAEPPTATDVTASVTTTVNTAVGFVQGYADIFGMIFSSGTGASAAADMIFGAGAESNPLLLNANTCAFRMGSTSASAPFVMGRASTARQPVIVNASNCMFRFGNIGQTFAMGWHTKFSLSNSRPDGAGTDVTTLFAAQINVAICDVDWADSDLTDGGTFAYTNLVSVATFNVPSTFDFRRCKLDAGKNIITGSFAGASGPIVSVWNCDSGDTNYKFTTAQERGIVSEEVTLVRSGGASDGDTAFSMKMDSTSTVNVGNVLRGLPIAWEQKTLGSPVTIDLEIIFDDATNLTNAEFWPELSYLGTSGAPLGVILSGRIATPLTTPVGLTTSTATWATSGFSNEKKRKVSLTFTPQEKGFYVLRPCLARASETVYVDPLIIPGATVRLLPGFGLINIPASGGGSASMLVHPGMNGRLAA